MRPFPAAAFQRPGLAGRSGPLARAGHQSFFGGAGYYARFHHPGVLARLDRLLRGLVVKPERMRENMERSYGLYFSQRVLTALIATGLPRQQAYEAVQRLAMQSWESRTPFPDLVRADAAISGRLGAETLKDLFDPAYYLRYEDAIFERVLAAPLTEDR